MHNMDISYMQSEESSSNHEIVYKRRRSVSSDRTFSRDSETGERVSVLIPAGDGNSKVRFYRFSSVVLIPSRTEYRAADCDLWWHRDDFVGFQQSASSELRMLCNIDNIGVREARRRLYQPEYAQDAEKRRLHDLGGDYSSDSMSRSTSSLFSMDSDDSDEHDFFGNASTNSQFPQSPSKLSLHVFQSAGNLASLNHETTEMDVDVDPNDVARKLVFAVNSQGVDNSNDTSSAPELQHWNLHLCVPLKPFTVPLVLEPVHASHHSLRPSRRTQRQEDSGFLAVMGFCSFALPIVGYLLFSNSKVSLFQAFA